MSLAFFRAALERDSTFADAWAGIADAWSWIGDNFAPNRLAAEAGRVAARRALALDSTSGRAAASVAYGMMTVDYDWSGAESALRRAIALDSRSIEARLLLTEVLTATGRLDEAWREVEGTWAIDSLNPRTGYYITAALTCARRYGDLLRWSERTTSLSGLLRFQAYLGSQRPDSALAYAASVPSRAVALAASGQIAEARDAITEWAAVQDSAQRQGQVVFVGSDREAMAWASVGERDRAFTALERSYDVRSGNWLPFLKCWPLFDPLRDDPRYHDLLRRMHLEP